MADLDKQTEEALGWAAEGKKLAVDIPEVSFKDAATFVASATPIIGDAMAAKEVYDELQKDEPNYYLAGALGGAALVGLVPGLGDAAAKAIKKGAKEVFEVAKRVEVDPNTMGSGLGNVRLKPKQDDVAEAESNALGVPKNKPEEFSGTIRLQHGYRGNKPTEFVPQTQYKGDRYDSDGGVFGDKPLYMEDPDNPAFLGDSQVIPFSYDDVVDVDASFDKAFFMQILPDSFCQEFSGKIINIHHSFLPAFIGANPYRQAHERGVKLIGATCHYVTADLDAGPIIEQEVERVSHFHSPADLSRLGRHCERIALAKGIRYHVHDRTLIDGHRAIVFPD